MNTTQTPLTLTVIGASQGTGALLVDLALAAGHHVRSVSRRTPPADGRPGHTSVTGDATDPAVLDRAITGADAVAVLVGSPANAKGRIRTPVTKAVIQAMHKAQVRRLVVQSSFGVGDSYRRIDLMTRFIVFPFMLKNVIADHNTQEDAVRGSGLEWTILRPGYLNDNPPNGKLMAIPSDHPGKFGSKVTRADVAERTLQAVLSDRNIGESLMLVGQPVR